MHILACFINLEKNYLHKKKFLVGNLSLYKAGYTAGQVACRHVGCKDEKIIPHLKRFLHSHWSEIKKNLEDLVWFCEFKKKWLNIFANFSLFCGGENCQGFKTNFQKSFTFFFGTFQRIFLCDRVPLFPNFGKVCKNFIKIFLLSPPCISRVIFCVYFHECIDFFGFTQGWSPQTFSGHWHQIT